MACCGVWQHAIAREGSVKVKNLKKAVTVTIVAGGLVAGGAGSAIAGGVGGDGANAAALAAASPGVLSGNIVQIPVHIPVNLCGNTVNVIGALNPTFGNTCINGNLYGHGKKH
jgi:hypothetical protein